MSVFHNLSTISPHTYEQVFHRVAKCIRTKTYLAFNFYDKNKEIHVLQGSYPQKNGFAANLSVKTVRN